MNPDQLKNRRCALDAAARVLNVDTEPYPTNMQSLDGLVQLVTQLAEGLEGWLNRDTDIAEDCGHKTYLAGCSQCRARRDALIGDGPARSEYQYWQNKIQEEKRLQAQKHDYELLDSVYRDVSLLVTSKDGPQIGIEHVRDILRRLDTVLQGQQDYVNE